MSTRLQLIEACDFSQEIKKSRFLALARPISSADAALAMIKSLHRSDARHHCWAYRHGEDYRFSDDGEPGGTAGRPILQAIDGRQADQLVVVVIRWFGGIKLGTGGLVRAYGGTAAECLREARYQPVRASSAWKASCELRDLPLLRARLGALDAEIGQESYTEQGTAWLHFQAPDTCISAIRDCVGAITRRADALQRDD
ncbi:IMPACT family protein [Frateuria aurantia]